MTARSSRTSRLDGELELPAGNVGWVRDGSPTRRPIYICGHGAGAPYTSPFMEAVGVGLAKRGVCVLRFHFPYMQRAVRDGRRYPPDRPATLLETCRAVVDLGRGWLPKTRRSQASLFVGGKSMGGRMMSMLLAEEDVPAVAGAIYLGYPLHPPGRTDKLRTAHLASVRVPQLFISGTRDSLAKRELLEPAVQQLKRAKLHSIDGGDHSLAIKRREPLLGSDTWLDAAAAFIAQHAHTS